jgi:predicted MFS family arabinose efflux permease
MALAPRETVSLRVQAGVYGAAMVNFSMAWVSGVVVALWLIEIQTPPYLIGIVLGSRHALTVLLSIHGGALMDRLGAKRIMVGFGIVGVVAPLLFPITPWIPGIIVLQMVAGLSEAMGWMGAQTLSGSAMKANPVYIGRMSFAARLGGFGGPWIIGIIWDRFGIWPSFLAMSIWSAIALVAALQLPAGETDVRRGGGARVRPRDLMPRLSDYLAAAQLIALPAVGLIMFATLARIGGTGIQNSFYVVYLKSIGIDGSAIGALLGVANFFGGIGAFAIAPLVRRIHPHWLVIVIVTLTVLAIAATPLLSGIYLLLMAVIGMRGLCLGISQPLEIAITSRALGPDMQGTGVGLRTTANRLASTAVPMIMGGVADFVGIEHSFMLMGVVLLVVMAAAAVYVWRSPVLGRDEPGGRV